MGGRGGSPNPGPQAPAAQAASSPEGQILNALRGLMRGRLAESPGLALSNNWISFATLREALPDISRETFDRAIIKMSIGSSPILSTIPVANQKSLKKRHWDAGVSIGGEINQITRIREKKDL